MSSLTAEGRCGCGKVVFRTHRNPLIVHACHCHHCKRQTGSSHALNALIENCHVELLTGDLVCTKLATPSGAGQTISRCKFCLTALWSHYHRFPAGDLVSFVRVGTLDQCHRLDPDVHIYAKSMCSQLKKTADVPKFEEFYDIRQTWRKESLARLSALVNEK